MSIQQFSSSLLENAVNEFARLPGIGRKTALRLVLHLLKQSEHEVKYLGMLLFNCEKKFCIVRFAIIFRIPMFAGFAAILLAITKQFA